jgi:putative tryptophan/tyrosine transport system substrate-binding protein
MLDQALVGNGRHAVLVEMDDENVAAELLRPIPRAVAGEEDGVLVLLREHIARGSGYLRRHQTARRNDSRALLGKCVELFRDALPGIRTVGALGNASDPFSKPFFDEVRSVGKATGIETPEVMVNVADEIDSVLASMKKDGAEAVIVQGSLATQHVASLMFKHRLPAASFARSFVEVGGLMSYGANVSDVFRRSAVFVAKILQGRRPEDLPVERPTNFELVINLKTAKALELKIAESFLLRANQLIE